MFTEYLLHMGQQELELRSFLSHFHGRAMILDTEVEDEELNAPQLHNFFCNIGDSRFTVPRQQPDIDCIVL